jgi:amino acid adenylation domain-containing protein
VLEADAHQDLPFEKLVEELQPERHLNHTPLFQVMLALNNTGEVGLELPGLQLRPLLAEGTTAKFDLTLALEAGGGVLRGAFEYNTDLFDCSTIERMVSHYQTLLEAVVADPQARLKDLPLLTEAERHQILVEWNDTEKAYPSDKCIHQLFEEQVEKTPEAVAVVFEDQQLSYGELNVKANQLAHHLRGLGVKPDTLVAICVERSLEMVIGLLGILKAGGAYVPLDPDYPAERLAYMLQDTAAPVLLTQGRLKERLPAHQARTVCLDEDWEAIGKSESTDPVNHTHPLNLAYCIYTSGSTGRPKGVAISHRNLVASTTARHAVYAETGNFLLLSSISFDSSVAGVFGTLTSAGTIVVARSDDVRDATRLLEVIERHGVETILCIPTMYQRILEHSTAERNCDSLRSVILAGEICPPALIAKSYNSAKRLRVSNEYGPTEAAVWSTVYLCVADETSTIPIGGPISNCQIFILDEAAAIVPIGVGGEIHIAGAGLARGYLNRPDLTAEKFIANPYGEPGSRMYRTGDLGRYLPDGNIEFLGRIDHQVKIRGFRIELGEIENALLAHAQVREAVVLAREDDPGNKRLVAYVVGKAAAQAPSLTISELRSHLGRTLPEYMVPSAWVFLDALPLNPNGKIDRKALPAPETTREDLGTEYVAPRTPTEELLAQIWAEVLKVERVGIHDNFFALGGHSLLATQVVSRIRQRLKSVVSLRTLFQAPTPAQLAVRLQPFNALASVEEALQPGGVGAPSIPADDKVAVKRPWFPLTIGQFAIYVRNDRINPSYPHYNISGAWKFSGEVDPQRLERAWNAVLKSHQALRLVVGADRIGRPVQRELPYRWQKLRVDHFDAALYPDEGAGEFAQHIARHGAEPFYLSTGPKCRIRLMHFGARGAILLLSVHHAFADGESLRLILAQLSACYAQPVQLANVGIAPRFADFAAEQGQLPDSESGRRMMRFWSDYLAGPWPALRLGGKDDHPQLDHAFELPIGLESMRRIAATLATTPFALALAAFALAVSQAIGESDLLIETPLSLRTRLDYEAMVGRLAEIQIVRVRAEAGRTPLQVLEHTTQVLLQVLENQSLPLPFIKTRLSRDQKPALADLRFHYISELHEAELRFGESAAQALDVGAPRKPLRALEVIVTAHPGRLAVRLKRDPTRTAWQTVLQIEHRMASHLRQLAGNVPDIAESTA